MKLNEVSSKIKNKTKIFVNGVVSYSHIATKIAGAELDRANQYTNFPSKDPYFKMTIKVDGNDPKQYIEFDPGNESECYLAAYAGSRVYQSKKEENKGINYFTALSKGNEIRVYKLGEDGKLHKVALNGNELGDGCQVKLELQYFESKFGPGVGLNSVVIIGDIKLFEGSNSVKGFDVADDTVTLPKREFAQADIAQQDAVAEEMPVADNASEVEVDEEPVGSTTAEANTAFDQLLKEFKAGN